MGDELSDQEVLARQYRDDRNLRARQRLWEISRSEPDIDFNRWSVDVLGANAGDLVLDVGCGNGRPLALLRELGCIAVAVDQSLGMVAPLDHELVATGDVQALPFVDGAFDAAAAFMMLYHVPDQTSAVHELRRVLKGGGVAVATTASASNQTELREIVERAVGHGWTWMRPSTASFHLENGADVMAAAFDSVEIVEAPERRIHITDADALADYIASSAEHFSRTLPRGCSWADVVESVRSEAAATITAEGAFVVSARLGAIVCR